MLKVFTFWHYNIECVPISRCEWLSDLVSQKHGLRSDIVSLAWLYWLSHCNAKGPSWFIYGTGNIWKQLAGWTHPGKHREKRAEDGGSDGSLTKAWDGIVTDTPLVDHGNEGYQVSHSPETCKQSLVWKPTRAFWYWEITWEWQVRYDEMFPRLDTGHLVKEKLADKEA